MKFFKSFAIAFVSAFLLTKEALAATQLTEADNEITINNADSWGMPTSVTIQYVSDLGDAETAQATNKLYLEWSMTSGNTYYTGGPPPGTLTVDSSTAFTIALTRSGTNPVVGDYDVILDVKLKYDNAGTVVTMDNVIYTFAVNVQGTAGSSQLDSTSAAGTVGGFTAGEKTDETEGDGQIVSPTPPLTLAQEGGSSGFGADVVVRVATTNTNYAIWVVGSETVTAGDQSDFLGTNYNWPAAAVTSTVEAESGFNQSVDITLSSVPVLVYDWGTVYIRLTCHYRDASNDKARRGLRSLQDGEPLGEGSAQVEGVITFDSNNSASFQITSIKFLTGVAATGAALLI